jgi:hypothetical protein
MYLNNDFQGKEKPIALDAQYCAPVATTSSETSHTREEPIAP